MYLHSLRYQNYLVYFCNIYLQSNEKNLVIKLLKIFT